MSRTKAPEPPDEYVVQRVDCASPPCWFRGYREGGHTETTTDNGQAARMSLDNARLAVYAVRIDRGGVWGIRRA